MYKYNCSTFKFLQMESGITPPPVDNPNYIVVQPNKGDKAVAENKEYEFDGDSWIFIKDLEEIYG